MLAQPGSASWAERNWSIYGQIKTAGKSRMQHKVADKLVYSHETIHLQNKLQDAGWEAEGVACTLGIPCTVTLPKFAAPAVNFTIPSAEHP